ncbi:MAG TPA: alpha-amylase/4-alpha-glucanotransferase domain-containing protein [Candidatus Limnocylindrales bacterium]|jgi:alpha-amylase|nr:alpha-amylase/4-alpha-glucanotransferase domain-containing protein [Candidatus Limnocylindrales bacterium]
MAPRIALALAIHNHQPVGNFGWVLAEVFEQAYEPMIAALERHPHVRLSLHYSGPLLDWLRAERPDFVGRLGGLIARGQVEIMGGGYYEPVLASLPERDRIGQASRMADELETLFGRRPAGAWLAERVWEPDLPTSLVAAGYDWTILDDAHFRAAAIGEDDLWGAYTTDDQGQRLRVFGTEQGLRYRIPFREVDDVISYLREHASEDGRRIGTMGDDGEKFGAWPTTWDHCWGARRWVDRFFAALDENADWLTTTTPTDWLAQHQPIGRVYVPTGSYAEMGQWALPPDESRAFAAALHAAQGDGRPEVRWLRGASWRNFQVRYREINDLHKQMLRTSDKVAAMADGPARALATDHLYQGQSNDCYWHGLFGGIYIAHMRLATYAHLIAAEDLADHAAGRLHAYERLDLDLDGLDDVRLATAGEVVSVDLAEGAGIGGWDIRPVRHALCAVLRRRPEAYHETLRDEDAAALEGATDATGAPASIHERLAMKEEGLAARLHYDRYERRSGLVRFLGPAVDANAWATAEMAELGDAIDGAFEITELGLDRLVATRSATVTSPLGPAAVDVTKTIELGGDRRAPTLVLTVTVHNRSAIALESRVGVEWTLMLLGGGANPAAWWDVDGLRAPHDSAGGAIEVARLDQGNDFVGIALTTTVSEPATAWWAPVETVSNSEGGFERVYQGAGLLLSWPLALAPDASWTVTVTQAVATDRDLAEQATAS